MRESQYDLLELLSDPAITDLNNNDEEPIYAGHTCPYMSPQTFITTPNIHSQSCIASFTINCRSLNANYDELKDLVGQMTTENFSFDIIGLTEVFTINSMLKYELDGYHDLQYKTRNSNGGGVGLYIKDNLNYKVRDDLSVFIPHVIETLFVEICLSKSKSLIAGIVYRPNTLPKADIDIFISSISDILDIINRENKMLLLSGDFNIDLLQYDTHGKTRTFIDNCFASGALPIITKPTRITSHSATLIDHVYCNLPISKVKSGIIITDIADHFGTFAILDINQNKLKSTQTKAVRSFTKTNLTNFKSLLNNSDFSTVTNSNDANISYNNFMEIFKRHYETSFPIKIVHLKRKYQKREPWMTSGLLTSSINKSKAYQLQLRKPTVANKQQFKTIKTVFNRVKRQAKNSYYKDIFSQYKSDIKQTWQTIRSLINSPKKTQIPSTCFRVNDKLITDPKQIAEELNTYFVNIGQSISTKIQAPNNQTFKTHLKGHFPDTFSFRPILPDDLKDITKRMKPKFSQGHDNISSKLIIDSINETALPLSHIINLSLSTGIVPTHMKTAKVIPIFKTGDSESFNNYRPISLLPAFSKILEKVVYSQTMSFLNKFNILYNLQFGFRKKHSTFHPILHFLKNVTESNDSRTKDFTIGTFLDLSKAFDTISHKILLEKLSFYGFRGIVNDWFRNYLTGRKQFSSFQCSDSSLLDIICGVPQGSILGPLLFLIYINDISACTSLKLVSFADDTTVYISGHNITDITNRLNIELNKLYEWLCCNKLSLNINKSQFMIFSPKSPPVLPSNLTVMINNIPLSQAGNNYNNKSVKFLGITLEENLSWSTHIGKLCNKISRSIFILNRLKRLFPFHILRTLYFALVHCHLIYGIHIWGNSSHVNKLFKLQKKAIRIINKAPYNCHTDPLFHANLILKIKDIYHLQASVFMHDYKNHRLPTAFNGFFQDLPDSHRTTRQANNIYIKRSRTNFSSNLPFKNIPHIWNNLNVSTKTITNRNQFKNKLKRDHFSTYN